MNIGFLIGLVLGLILLVYGILVAGGSLLMFWDLPSCIITFGGSWCAMMVSYPFATLTQMPKLFRIALFPPKLKFTELILLLISFSEKSRREGLLSLEDEIESVEDQFLKKALRCVVDGMDPEVIRTILEIDIDSMAARHDANKKIFDDWAGLAPSFGMIGTLMGLVMMLVNLNDKAMVGPYLAVAIITTFYGAVFAYLVLTPISTNLDTLTGVEILYDSIAIMGVMGIQSGDNPTVLKQKLISFLPPAERAEYEKEL